MPIPIIDDSNWQQFVGPPRPDGTEGYGLVPRDYQSYPSGYLTAAPEFPDELLVPKDQQQKLLDEQIANRASGFDLREAEYATLKSLNQNPFGLCWAFSTTKCVMYTRMRMGLPNRVLSAWYVAGRIKNWRDQGGWNLQSCQFAANEGIPEMSLCPSYNRRFDTAETRADCANNRITEWWDSSDNDANKRVQQMISMFLLGMFPALDFNWWAHSVAGCRLVSINPLVIDIDNSWGENMGEKGIYRLKGSRAIPSAMTCPKLIVPR